MITPRRVHRSLTLFVVLLAATLASPAMALAAAGASDPATDRAAIGPAPSLHGHQETLRRYARDTWASMAAMTDPKSGLPADSLNADGTASVQTSTTNIGAYLWSTLVADELGIIKHKDAISRLDRTLTTLAKMERHEPSGQFFNWYNHHTGAKLTAWPPTGAPLTPILSSVDNGWLATGLHVVAASEPKVAAKAKVLFDSMDFGFYYRPEVNRIAFHVVPTTGVSPCCYDTIVSESRIASYIGIATGQLPAKEYFGSWRTFPATCDWSWQETRPVGFNRTYLGINVFEGAYQYDGMRIVPGWGGSMFEALMPAMFVPEDEWGKKSWAINHPLTVAAHIHHGLEEAGYGYWGFSPSNRPAGGYREYGVDGIGLNPGGYASNEDNTLVDHGSVGCGREPTPDPPPSAYKNGVVTPHASFLALRYAPKASLANLAKLERDFQIYDKWGFRDSVNVQTGVVSDSYLSLDQGIIMAALGNALRNDMLRDAFATRQFKRALQPVIKIEEFNAGPRDRVEQLD